MTTAVFESESTLSADWGLSKLLGKPVTSSLQLVGFIERGFSFQTLERFHRETGLPMELLAAAIGISPRTFSRRKKEKKLTSSESDRLVSISRLFALTVELFEGNKEKSFQWFLNQNRALGNLSPLQMAATETGSREVENLIGRLEHGVFS